MTEEFSCPNCHGRWFTTRLAFNQQLGVCKGCAWGWDRTLDHKYMILRFDSAEEYEAWRNKQRQDRP